MPPRTSKLSPAPAAAATAANETHRTADALWLFEQFLHCDPPVILNVTPISEATGMKPNTIVKRINTMQHRYPGFGIVTRTTGARQSSNLVAGTPVTPVKKAAGKGTGTGSKSKKVEIVEEDEEDGGKRQTRAKGRVERKVSGTKIKTNDEAGEQAQASSEDEDSDEPSTPTIEKSSKKTKPQKKSTSKQPLPDSSDNDTDASEQTEVEEDTPAKKIVTPKTRGGRKSAGIGEIKDLRAYPEKPVPRGRHAIPKKDKASDANITKDDGVESDTESVGKKGTDNVPTGTKRKRSETAESQSSPLTPSPAIKQRLAEMNNTEKSEKEGSHANKLDSSEMPPPSKKQKKIHEPNEDNIDTEPVVQEGTSLATQESSEAQPVPTRSQEDTSTQIEAPQSVVEAALDACPNTAAEPEQDVDRIMTTPLGQNIDEIPDASDEAGDSGELAAEDDKVMEAPESPTAGRGKPVKPVKETVPKITVMPVLEATASEVTTMKPKVMAEAEILPDPIESGVEEASSTEPPKNIKDITAKDTNAQELPTESTKREAPNNSENPIVPNATRSVRTERGRDAKESEQSKSESQFSQPLEWMIWNPTAKPGKSKYATEVGRVLP